MMLNGVFAASITPLRSDFSPDLRTIPKYLDFLASRGCHGALLLGTTGEGPSFSVQQRVDIVKIALEVHQDWPEFHLLAGTGLPSLDETISLNRELFDLGLDGVIILPPFYFRGANDDGLYSWYKEVIENSVPKGKVVFAYNVPGVSGVGLSLSLLARLHDDFPHKFAGLKDSSGDEDYARKLCQTFGHELQVFSGNDRLFSHALNNSASGCITAAANLISPELRALWDTYQAGQSTDHIQGKINSFRAIIEEFTPFPPVIKYLLARLHNFPHWSVCPPLSPLSEEQQVQVSRMLDLA
jgi:4-hydroxy-tetrahydrodipicolinate synthase